MIIFEWSSWSLQIDLRKSSFLCFKCVGRNKPLYPRSMWRWQPIWWFFQKRFDLDTFFVSASLCCFWERQKNHLNFYELLILWIIKNRRWQKLGSARPRFKTRQSCFRAQQSFQQIEAYHGDKLENVHNPLTRVEPTIISEIKHRFLRFLWVLFPSM